jgi:hypothetical protein
MSQNLDPNRKIAVDTWQEAIEKAAMTAEHISLELVAPSERPALREAGKIIARQIRKQKIALIMPYVPLQQTWTPSAPVEDKAAEVEKHEIPEPPLAGPTKVTEGWGFPGRSQKAHYFVHTDALCGKWGFYVGPLEIGNDGSPDNCAECKRRKAKGGRS